MRPGLVASGLLVLVAAGASALPYEAGNDAATLLGRGLGAVGGALLAPALPAVADGVGTLGGGRGARAAILVVLVVAALGGAMSTWFLLTFRLTGSVTLSSAGWALLAAQALGLAGGLARGAAALRRPAEGRGEEAG